MNRMHWQLGWPACWGGTPGWCWAPCRGRPSARSGRSWNARERQPAPRAHDDVAGSKDACTLKCSRQMSAAARQWLTSIAAQPCHCSEPRWPHLGILDEVLGCSATELLPALAPGDAPKAGTAAAARAPAAVDLPLAEPAAALEKGEHEDVQHLQHHLRPITIRSALDCSSGSKCLCHSDNPVQPTGSWAVHGGGWRARGGAPGVAPLGLWHVPGPCGPTSCGAYRGRRWRQAPRRCRRPRRAGAPCIRTSWCADAAPMQVHLAGKRRMPTVPGCAALQPHLTTPWQFNSHQCTSGRVQGSARGQAASGTGCAWRQPPWRRRLRIGTQPGQGRLRSCWQRRTLPMLLQTKGRDSRGLTTFKTQCYCTCFRLTACTWFEDRQSLPPTVPCAWYSTHQVVQHTRHLLAGVCGFCWTTWRAVLTFSGGTRGALTQLWLSSAGVLQLPPSLAGVTAAAACGGASCMPRRGCCSSATTSACTSASNASLAVTRWCDTQLLMATSLEWVVQQPKITGHTERRGSTPAVAPAGPAAGRRRLPWRPMHCAAPRLLPPPPQPAALPCKLSGKPQMRPAPLLTVRTPSHTAPQRWRLDPYGRDEALHTINVHYNDIAHCCAAWRASNIADDSLLRLGRPSLISDTREPNASVLRLSPADEACNDHHNQSTAVPSAAKHCVLGDASNTFRLSLSSQSPGTLHHGTVARGTHLGRDVYEHHGLSIARQRILQQRCELGVAEGHVRRLGRERLQHKHMCCVALLPADRYRVTEAISGWMVNLLTGIQKHGPPLRCPEPTGCGWCAAPPAAARRSPRCGSPARCLWHTHTQPHSPHWVSRKQSTANGIQEWVPLNCVRRWDEHRVKGCFESRIPNFHTREVDELQAAVGGSAAEVRDAVHHDRQHAAPCEQHRRELCRPAKGQYNDLHWWCHHWWCLPPVHMSCTCGTGWSARSSWCLPPHGLLRPAPWLPAPPGCWTHKSAAARHEQLKPAQSLAC